MVDLLLFSGMENNLLSNDDKYFVKVMMFLLEKPAQLSTQNLMDLNNQEANAVTV